jgi:hypothetical protein
LDVKGCSNIFALVIKFYVKDEGSNLNTMIGALKIVVSCDILGLEESYQGTCFWACIFQALSICYNE